LDIYSVTLLASMIMAGLAGLAAIAPAGHGPDSAEPMRLGEFLKIHPALPVVAVVAIAALLTGITRRAKET
jgi:hypothetical protein